MHIILQPTETQIMRAGTPIRLWRGFTDDGFPVLAGVLGIATPKGGVTDGRLESVAVPPLDSVGINGRTVLRSPSGIAFGFWWV